MSAGLLGAALSIPPAHSRQGVTKGTITIGVHGPVTGASPLPSDSLQQGADIYWRWRKHHDRPIKGRHVEVVFKNDNTNPSQAVAVCKEMVEQDNVFLLSGLLNPEGKDQVQSCARYAASVGVPYVSLGQMKTGVAELPRYFAFSASWARQARLLADYMLDRLGAGSENNGMVRFDTPNYTDTHDAFVSAMSKRKNELEYDRSVSRGAGATEAELVIGELKNAEIENVFVLVSPIWFLQLLKAADNQNYHPQWLGVGMTLSVTDSVVRVGCSGDAAVRGTKVLSPLPAFDDHREFDDNYSKAMQEIYNDTGDMVTWLGWGTSRQLAKLLERAGRDLSRRRFVRSSERARDIRTGILPALNFSPRDHFGGKGVHVLEARCTDERWHTKLRFKRGF
ncbi:MAG TPA: ABC transporter substrate-binding protein [Actinomycetota bacterium]|nr:ABC transporter substrate-binding protein [Actinomycetota bacterium]